MTIRASEISESRSTPAVCVGVTKKREKTIYRDFGKRGVDLLLVAAMAPIVVPAILILALVIALDGHNPFYWQSRVGRNGRSFRLWKLRTMVPHADEKLEDFLNTNAEARREWDNNQKLRHDPRITWIGRFLRKSSADEFPQLLNVLRGEMSLVGPRPMMEAQREMYPGKAYYRMRPGITGPWQISDRNDCSFRGRAQYDDRYETDMSLKGDLRILSGTLSVVIRCTGY